MRREGAEYKNLFEKIMTENFPNLVKRIDVQVQEAQRVSNKINSKKPTPKHIIIKWQRLMTKRESKKQQEKGSFLPTRELS